MKVFMSWSGERSKLIAQVFYSWLPTIIQNLEPWMSEHDIHKGTRALRLLGKELQDNFFGLIYLTPENLNEPWVNYEAGALSKDEENSRVWTVLHELQYSDVEGPLAQFQHTKLERADILKLLQAINVAGASPLIKDDQLRVAFDRGWGELEEALRAIPTTTATLDQGRSSDDMIREMLEILREQPRQLSSIRYRRDLQRLTNMAHDIRRLVNILETIQLPDEAGVRYAASRRSPLEAWLEDIEATSMPAQAAEGSDDIIEED